MRTTIQYLNLHTIKKYLTKNCLLLKKNIL